MKALRTAVTSKGVVHHKVTSKALRNLKRVDDCVFVYASRSEYDAKLKADADAIKAEEARIKKDKEISDKIAENNGLMVDALANMAAMTEEKAS